MDPIKNITKFQAECKHPGDAVRADILQADVPGTKVQWCYSCGAYHVGHYTEVEQYPRHYSEWEVPNARDAAKIVVERGS